MEFIRYSAKDSGASYGWLLGNEIGPVEGNIFGEFHRLDTRYYVDEVNLLPPVEPSKIICIGRNYIAHAKEHKVDVPSLPLLFLKPPSAIIGPGETIILPRQSNQVEHEAELVVVIGSKCFDISPDEAIHHILGYTIGNDITARDLQSQDNQWTRAKGFDTFCPIGPWITTEFDPMDAMISCLVNNEIRQMGSTRDMVFSVNQLVAYISSVMTLFPGDLIFTGTPSGVGPISENDVLETRIEGIGSLRNFVNRKQ